jgi:hypothetical protein
MKNIITEEMFDYYKPTFDIELHDVDKIMYVKYDYEHPHLPQDRHQMRENRVDGRKRGGRRMCRTKTYIDFMNVVSQYCEDMGFRLEYEEKETGWCKYNKHHYDVLIPKYWRWSFYEWNRHPVKWYNNEFFRKLVEDNGGICPLPLTKPKGTK